VTLRLPLHGGFETMQRVEDVPIIARHSRSGRERTRQILGVDPQTVVALASFGAYGVSLPIAAITSDGSFTLMVTDREAPASQSWDGGDRLLRVSEARLAACGLGYPDLVAAADVVVTKPGYGIVSECIANAAALLYTSRGRFPEYELFVREMPALLPCRYIAQEDLRAGRWAEAIDALLRQPVPPGQVPTNGAEIGAERILAEAGA
jgi:L-arabinokinase